MGVNVRNTFLERDPHDINSYFNQLWTSGMRKAEQRLTWNRTICAWFNQEAAVMNGDVARCIVLLLLCLYFLYLNCLWAAQSIKVIIKCLRHPPRGSEEFQSAMRSHRWDVFTSRALRGVNTMGQIPLGYGLYREHQRPQKNRGTLPCRNPIYKCLDSLCTSKAFLEVTAVSLSVGLRPTLHTNRMFSQNLISRCDAAHLIWSHNWLEVWKRAQGGCWNAASAILMIRYFRVDCKNLL